MARIPVVRSADDRNGMIAAAVYLLLVLFLLFFIKYKEPDPPKITVPIPIVMEDNGFDNFEIDNGGGGTPDETIAPTPTETKDPPKEQPTQEESEIQTTTGTGKTNNPSTPTTEEAPRNPFSGSGSGGQGTSGTGSGFGSDDGPGTGSGNPGKGSAGNRIRITKSISNPKTYNAERVKIAFQLVIDSRGTVVRVNVIRESTTTTNQQLIDEVSQIVKNEVKYNEKPDAANEVVYYTVDVKPN